MEFDHAAIHSFRGCTRLCQAIVDGQSGQTLDRSRCCVFLLCLSKFVDVFSLCSTPQPAPGALEHMWLSPQTGKGTRMPLPSPKRMRKRNKSAFTFDESPPSSKKYEAPASSKKDEAPASSKKDEAPASSTTGE